MYLKGLLAAATLPATCAIYDPDAPPVSASDDGSPPQPALMSLLPNGDDPSATAVEDGPVVATTLALVDGDVPPGNGDVAITSLPVDEEEEGDVATTENAVPVANYSSPIIGPTWTALRYYNANLNAMADVAQGSDITLEFEADGRFDGHAGCNRYSGSHTNTTEESFTVYGPLISTLMFCEEDIMDQEMAYLQIFEEGTVNTAVSEDGSTLELTDPEDGKVLAEYKLFSPAIIGTNWEATQIYNATSDALEDVVGTITLKMEVNERFDGNAGCNNYVGAYDDLTANSFVVDGPVGSTKMLCESEEVMAQENAYLSNLEDGRSIDWAVSDGVLELKDADTGVVLATYTAGLELLASDASTKQEPAEDDSGAMAIGATLSVIGLVGSMLLI